MRKLSAIVCLTVAVVSLLVAGQNTVFGQIPTIILPPEILRPETAEPLKPIELTNYSVSVRVNGFVCQTSATMTFYNPNNRQLAGDLQFPLPEGVTISGYALDVDGSLTDAVAVGKEKARVALETEMRRGVDPGIVEAVAGNQFKTRIFPLPAQGSRIVRVDYVSAAEFDAPRGCFVYRLSLNFAQPVKRFALRMEIVKPKKDPVLVVGDLEGLGFQNWSEGLFAETTKENFKPVKDVILELPTVDDRTTRIEKSSDGYYYFAAAVPVESLMKQVRDNAAAEDFTGKTATIFWDCSTSRGSEANLAKEQAVIEDWLSTAGLKSVRFVPVRNEIDESEIREVELADDAAIREFVRSLSELKYDGATNLSAITQFARPNEVSLLFTDGFANWGKTSEPIKLPGRLFVFSSGSAFDASTMTRMARDNQGAYFNLNLPSQIEAFKEAVGRIGSLLFVSGKAELGGAGADCESYPSTLDLQSGGPVRYLCGRLNPGDSGAAESAESSAVAKESLKAVLSATLEGSGSIQGWSPMAISIQDATVGESLRSLFAQTKLVELNLNPKENEKQIELLGKQYGLATSQTSLIVLESLDQYLRHEICPPKSLADMRKQYLAEIDNRKASNESDIKGREKNRIAYIGKLWKNRTDWWNKTFKYTDDLKLNEDGSLVQPRSIGNQIREVFSRLGSVRQRAVPLQSIAPAAEASTVERLEEADEVVFPAMAAPMAPTPTMAPAINSGDIGEMRQNRAASVDMDAAPAEDVPAEEDAEMEVQLADNSSAAEDSLNAVYGQDSDALREKNKQTVGGKAAVEVKHWTPNAEYIKAIQKEKEIGKAYEVYLERKKEYLKSPSFYLECADELKARKANDLAVRILSNLAEMDLENPQVLRVLGYRLLQWEMPQLAVPVFETVLTMRAEEPQSYRDLAIALSRRADSLAADESDLRKSDLKRALELYNTVVCGREYRPWDGRFPGIEAIALNEANQLVPIAKSAGIEEIPIRSEWLNLMDVDVRIAMTWSADNTDIDLWVTEPSGEKTYYGHNLSKIGGMITDDFTGGYGPEVYQVKRAMPGEYKIEAHYYGSRSVEILGAVTVQVDVYTHFGRSNQTRQSLTFPLKEAGRDKYEIGRIKFSR